MTASEATRRMAHQDVRQLRHLHRSFHAINPAQQPVHIPREYVEQSIAYFVRSPMAPTCEKVQPCVSALRGLRLFDGFNKERRSPDAPDIYIWDGTERYPQRLGPVPEDAGHPAGRTFFVFIDSSEEGKAREVERTKDMQIPYGRCEEIEQEHST